MLDVNGTRFAAPAADGVIADLEGGGGVAAGAPLAGLRGVHAGRFDDCTAAG